MIIYCFLCARHHPKCIISTISFNPQTNPMRWALLLSAFYRWELLKVPCVTQLVSDRIKIWNQAMLNPFHLLIPISSSQRLSGWKMQWVVSMWCVWKQASKTAGKSVCWYEFSKSNLALYQKPHDLPCENWKSVEAYMFSKVNWGNVNNSKKNKNYLPFNIKDLVNKW